MKFRNPETGEVYDDIKDALEHYCPAKDDRDVDACKRCAIGSSKNTDDTICTDFSVDHPTEAARLMGYEVIDDVPHDSSGTCGICENSTPFGICGMVKCTKTDRYLPCEHKCDLKEDNMEKNKPMSEWTLGEIKSFCSTTRECKDCIFTGENLCEFLKTPSLWALNEMETKAKGTESFGKPDKPRLAEVLGVEVGKRFDVDMGGYIMHSVVLCTSGLLKFFDHPEKDVPITVLCYAINHPESIIRTPRLTEAELAICKAVGAKWVERGGSTTTIYLLDKKPRAGWNYGDNGEKILATINGSLFPSVKPGDCICVEEAGGGE